MKRWMTKTVVMLTIIMGNDDDARKMTSWLTLEKMPNLLALATLPVYETVIVASEMIKVFLVVKTAFAMLHGKEWEQRQEMGQKEA